MIYDDDRSSWTAATLNVSARPASGAEAWPAIAYQPPKRKAIPPAGCSTGSLPSLPTYFFLYLSFLLLFYSSEKILLLAPIPFSLNTALILSVFFGHLRRTVAANDKSDSREKEK